MQATTAALTMIIVL